MAHHARFVPPGDGWSRARFARRRAKVSFGANPSARMAASKR